MPRPTAPTARPTLRVILGDQLTHSLSALEDIDPATDVVLMAEVMEECTYVPHHQRKLVLVLSAMRHHAAALRQRGLRVEYVALDDAANTGSLSGEVLRAAKRLKPARIVVTEPGEWRVLQAMLGWQKATGIEVEIRDDSRFLCSRRDFRDWARGKTTLRMEFFYREMRRRHSVLMQGDKPLGDRWNFDPENRKSLPATIKPPKPARVRPDAVTREVIALVAARFGDNMGDAAGFDLPVTAEDAEAFAQDFFSHRLAQFGDWQDAMRAGDATLFHSHVSAALNLGLLDPLALCRAAEDALARRRAPINAVEGFIRQILGWREFVRGIYWLHMPEYGQRNALRATRPLPWLYWSGETRMNCLRNVVGDTIAHGHAHHIQRLMVTGNFALLAGIDPAQVDEWYLAVYDDAYEWVEMPNTRGMALFADGGTVGSKPYAASGAYINRMSDYCGACAYDVKDGAGDNACPFNALYWDFIARHEQAFAGNIRMAMPLKNLQRMPAEKRAALRHRAAAFLAAMDRGDPV